MTIRDRVGHRDLYFWQTGWLVQKDERKILSWPSKATEIDEFLTNSITRERCEPGHLLFFLLPRKIRKKMRKAPTDDHLVQHVVNAPCCKASLPFPLFLPFFKTTHGRRSKQRKTRKQTKGQRNEMKKLRVVPPLKNYERAIWSQYTSPAVCSLCNVQRYWSMICPLLLSLVNQMTMAP